MHSPETHHDEHLPSSMIDIHRLQSPEGALYASSGEMYQSMVFGRDSLESADDMLRLRPDISASVIKRLSELQGNTSNDVNAEEPGKIPHQHMQLYIDGHRITPAAEEQMRLLSERWGGTDEGFTYYGSLDATPLFARLIARHCFVHGTEILGDQITDRAGNIRTVKESFMRSLEWMTNHLDSSELGLLEFRRINDRHIVIQSWRDSGSGFIHEDGTQANLDGFIAPIEVQAYAYDALIIASELLSEGDEQDQAHATTYIERAEDLRNNTLQRFWMPDRKQFAMGIDRDEQWRPRQITSASSSQGVMLDSRIFLDLDEEDRQMYVEGIVSALYSADFLTPVGLRCRGISTADLVDFSDYHGAKVSWAKESYDFAKGLMRQGFPKLAEDIMQRILNMVNISGENYEFLYVNEKGEVDYRPKALTPANRGVVDEVIIGTNLPDKGQAWTVSAVLGIKHEVKPKHYHAPTDWSQRLEQDLLQQFTPAPKVKTKEDVAAILKDQPMFAVDLAAGIESDKRWNPSWWV